MSTEGWDSNYSFLLQDIEGHISSNINNTTILSPSSNDNKEITSNKKRPLDSLDVSIDNSITHSGKKMRELVKIDEMQIQIEELQDKLTRQLNEYKLLKEESIRQLKHMNANITSLKKESKEYSEKYYEEKRKSQIKIRELENKLNKKISENTPVTTNNYNTTTSTYSNNNTHDEITVRLQQLEQDLNNKVDESTTLRKDKLQLESDLYKANQELSLLRGQDGMTNEAVIEARELRKKCAELESNLRRLSREHEQVKNKLKNQTMLEEDISALRSKLRLADESQKVHKRVQEEFQQLLEEKKLWNELFREISLEQKEMIQKYSDGNSDGVGQVATQMKDEFGTTLIDSQANKHVSPTQVLHLLGTYQKRCALLLQGQGQLQQSLSQMRLKLREVQSKVLENERQNAELSERAERADAQVRVAEQQGKLYAGEVTSLRSLLETFDVEFRIGKPDVKRILELKDTTIESLRTEIDRCRELSQQHAQDAADLRKELEIVKTNRIENDGSSINTSSPQLLLKEGNSSESSLQLKLDNLECDLHQLQHFTGLDYLPHKTKVLHLSENPITIAATNAGKESIHQPSTVPTVEQLHVLNKHLSAAIASSEESNAQSQTHHSTSDMETSDGRSASANNQSLNNISMVNNDSGRAVSQQAQADSAKLNQRLKEMFKERITSFREGVYLLTGYKIDLYAPDSQQTLPRLRLRSMYAEKPEDCLMFQLRGDCPELLDTDFASKLDPDMLKYLTTYNSVPAFLSNITLNLFENQTFMG